MRELAVQEERLLRRAEVARLLDISDATLDRLIQRRELQTVRLGPRMVRVPQSSVSAFISRAIRASSEPEPPQPGADAA